MRKLLFLRLVNCEGDYAVQRRIEELVACQGLGSPVRNGETFRQDDVESVAGDGGQRHSLADQSVCETSDTQNVNDLCWGRAGFIEYSTDVESSVGGDQRFRPEHRQRIPAELVDVKHDSTDALPAEYGNQPDGAFARIQSQACNARGWLSFAQRS